MVECMDLYYGQEMPAVWLVAHTTGAVFSPNAEIRDYFMFMHGCNVGLNNGYAPNIGEGVVMFGNSKIIEKCNVGNYVMFSANSYVKDMDIPEG